MNKSFGWKDTIVALATPPGVSAIAVIRLSGDRATEVVNMLFPSKNLHQQLSHTLHVGFLRENDTDIDEVVVSLFKSPTSYTGEDVVEISCHGSAYVQQQVIQACVRLGARLAKPGEFTQRAFLNGKLDLVQAEAVADLISADTAASQKTALYNIRGGFSIMLKQLREQLIQFSALIELELDFSEEDVEFADRKKLTELVEAAIQSTAALAGSFQLGNVIKNGVQVAIIGKPNAGKSTLLNTLLNENRAIVSEIAGTTRDTIEEVININGILFRLIDTAGIRQHSTDVIENIGIGKSLEKIQTADIILYLFDLEVTTLQEVKEDLQQYIIPGKKIILCGTKKDLFVPADKSRWTAELNSILEEFDSPVFIPIAAPEHTNIDLLKNELAAQYMIDPHLQNQAVVTNARHHAALEQVLLALQDIKGGLDNKISGDLLTLDIRRCLQYISEITGDITNEDVLDYIFSKFCIGK